MGHGLWVEGARGARGARGASGPSGSGQVWLPLSPPHRRTAPHHYPLAPDDQLIWKAMTSPITRPLPPPPGAPLPLPGAAWVGTLARLAPGWPTLVMPFYTISTPCAIRRAQMLEQALVLSVSDTGPLRPATFCFSAPGPARPSPAPSPSRPGLTRAAPARRQERPRAPRAPPWPRLAIE